MSYYLARLLGRSVVGRFVGWLLRRWYRWTPEKARAAAGVLPRRITPEVVEHLERSGASQDLVNFARRHMDRDRSAGEP